MITFYIVSNEAILQENNRQSFPWHMYHAKQIGCTVNDAIAFFEILSRNPDIVIIDVEMPRKNGIQMAKELRERGYQGGFIFLSVNREQKLEDVQVALRLGAINILLKPIQTDEMAATVQVAVSHAKMKCECQFFSIEEDVATEAPQHFRENVLWRSLLQGSYQLGDALPSTLRGEWDSFFVLVVNTPHIASVERQPLLKGWQVQLPETLVLLGAFSEGETSDCLVIGRKKDTIPYPRKKPAQKSQRLMQYFLPYDRDTQVFAGVAVKNPLLLCGSYQIALKSLVESQFTTGYYTLKNDQSLLTDEFSSGTYGVRIADILVSGTSEELKSALYDFFCNVTIIAISDISVLRNNCAVFCYAICSVLEQMGIGLPLTDFKKESEEAIRQNALLEIYRGLEAALLLMKEALTEEENRIILVHRVKTMIVEDLQNISIALLAETVGLSKNYLAVLFKRYTGRTIKNYITDTRLERAAELLRNGNLYTYEVADLVGYKDVVYFSKIFRQRYGCTPTEYKGKL